jgi:capsule polysaccharide export protein KpsE/RkpR
MDESFDAARFASYLRAHWRTPAIACGAAVVLAAAVSLLLPKQYTATASLLISPPAGNDPRAATAVSPVYLESLKTFERIASNDSLFSEALRHFHIPEAAPGRSIASLKRQILEVSKPTGTNILEIQATLHNARAAQALAQYLAERTVALRQSLDAGSEDDVTGEASRIVEAARTRMEHAQAARDQFTAAEPVEPLEDEVANTNELLFRLRRDLATARADLAQYEARRAQPTAARGAADTRWIENEIAAARARVGQYEQQEGALSTISGEKGRLLEKRKQRRDLLDAELKMARAEWETASTKLNDIRTSAIFRGERLQLIDPGIVPQRPSSPNLPLNVGAALFLSLVASVVYLALRFTYGRAPLVSGDRAYARRYPE